MFLILICSQDQEKPKKCLLDKNPLVSVLYYQKTLLSTARFLKKLNTNHIIFKNEIYMIFKGGDIFHPY